MRSAVYFAGRLKSSRNFQLNRLADFLLANKMLSKEQFLHTIGDYIGTGVRVRRQHDILSGRKHKKYIKSSVRNEEQSDEYYYENSVLDDSSDTAEGSTGGSRGESYALMLRKIAGRPKTAYYNNRMMLVRAISAKYSQKEPSLRYSKPVARKASTQRYVSGNMHSSLHTSHLTNTKSKYLYRPKQQTPYPQTRRQEYSVRPDTESMTRSSIFIKKHNNTYSYGPEGLYHMKQSITIKRKSQTYKEVDPESYKEVVMQLIIKYMKQRELYRVVNRLFSLIRIARYRLYLYYILKIKIFISEKCYAVIDYKVYVDEMCLTSESVLRFKMVQLYVLTREAQLLRLKVYRMHQVRYLIHEYGYINSLITGRSFIFLLMGAKAHIIQIYRVFKLKLRLSEYAYTCKEVGIPYGPYIAFYESYLSVLRLYQEKYRIYMEIKRVLGYRAQDLKYKLAYTQEQYYNKLKQVKTGYYMYLTENLKAHKQIQLLQANINYIKQVVAQVQGKCKRSQEMYYLKVQYILQHKTRIIEDKCTMVTNLIKYKEYNVRLLAVTALQRYDAVEEVENGE